MASDFGLKIGIEGEKEFKKSISEINSELKLLGSEMKLATSTFDKNEQSVESLTAANKVLEKQIDGQKNKVETLKQALDNATNSFGENDTRTKNWQQRLNLATADLNKMEIELQNNKSAIEEMSSAAKNNDLEEMDTDLNKVGVTATKVGVALGAAIVGIGVYLSNLSDDVTKANAQIAASTGATGEELEELGEIAKNVYANNFGDSLEDVADGLSTVQKNTKLVGMELETATESGFALRDVFGYDLQESSRTAKSLMENFGISAEEAYDIIATGAQNGADKNGDLLDSLNEYGVQFDAVGMSADEFVTTLIKGAESGVWSIDKLGDAVKEFNIRAKDGSDSTASAFEDLGLNADVTMKIFAKGGEEASDKFFEVVKSLEKMEDPLLENEVAVKLFGTQFEDLEKDVLPILASVESGVIDSVDALNSIKDVKYNDVESAIEGLSRTIESKLGDVASEFNDELTKKIIPGVIDWIEKIDIDDVVNDTKSLVDTAKKISPVITGIGTAIIAIKAKQQILEWTEAMESFSGVTVSTTGEVGTLSKTTTAFSAVLKANPIGVAVGAAVALGTAVSVLDDHMSHNNETAKILGDSIQDCAEKVLAAKEEYTSFSDAMAEEGSGVLAEIDYIENLKNKLFELTENKTKLSEVETEQAQFYLNELNPYLDDQLSVTDLLTGANGELEASIDGVIEKRKTEMLFEAYKDDYMKALTEQNELEKELGTALVAKQEAYSGLNELQKQNVDAIMSENTSLDEKLKRLETLNISEQGQLDNYISLIEQTESLSDTQSGYMAVMSSYDEALQASSEGRLEDAQNLLTGMSDIETLMLEMQGKTIEEKREILQNGIEAEELLIAEYEARRLEGDKTVTDEMIAECTRRKDELVLQHDALGSESLKAEQEGMKKEEENLTNLTAAITKKQKEKWETLSGSTSKRGSDTISNYKAGMNKEKSSVTKATSSITGSLGGVWDTLKNGNTSKGKSYIANFTAGMNKSKSDAYDGAYTIGTQITSGQSKGIKDTESTAISRASSLAESTLSTIKKVMGIASPSKETAWMGEMLVLGMSNSIQEGESEVIASAEHLSKKTLDAFKPMSDGINTIDSNFLNGNTLKSDIDIDGTLKTQIADLKVGMDTTRIEKIIQDGVNEIIKSTGVIVLDTGIVASAVDSKLGNIALKRARGY